MLHLYNVLSEHRTRIVSLLLKQIPREVKAYKRITQGEILQSIDHLYDAYLELLASGSDERLRHNFTFIARMRVPQGFPLSAILRAFFLFNSAARQVIQENYLLQENNFSQFNEAMSKLESTTFSAAAIFSDIFWEYVQSQVDEHNQYLQQKNKQLGIDLSKFVLFRA